MFENLQVFENRYEELNNKLYDPQTAADRALYAALMKEHKELSPIVEAYRAYLRCERDLQGARELLEEGRGPGAPGRWPSRRSGKRVPSSPALRRSSNSFCCLGTPTTKKTSSWRSAGAPAGKRRPFFAYNLYRMYTSYAEKKGWKTELLSLNETELGGF